MLKSANPDCDLCDGTGRMEVEDMSAGWGGSVNYEAQRVPCYCVSEVPIVGAAVIDLAPWPEVAA